MLEVKSGLVAELGLGHSRPGMLSSDDINTALRVEIRNLKRRLSRAGELIHRQTEDIVYYQSEIENLRERLQEQTQESENGSL